jgi:AcrB/AcrD/AcrF family protein
MVVAMVPLLIAKGAGAASRFDIGLVIAAGMTIGTMFTLFVTPAVYTYLARDHQKAKARKEAHLEPILVHAAPGVQQPKAPVETLEEADAEAKAGMLFPAEPEPAPGPPDSPVSPETLAFTPAAVASDQHGPERRAAKHQGARRRFPTAAE